MLAFPSMLIAAAERAGMKVPELADDDSYNREEFPHFAVFCAVQLCRRMADIGEHWDNAKVISAIPDDEIRSVTLEDLLGRGLSWAN